MFVIRFGEGSTSNSRTPSLSPQRVIHFVDALPSNASEAGLPTVPPPEDAEAPVVSIGTASLKSWISKMCASQSWFWLATSSLQWVVVHGYAS